MTEMTNKYLIIRELKSFNNIRISPCRILVQLCRSLLLPSIVVSQTFPDDSIPFFLNNHDPHMCEAEDRRRMHEGGRTNIFFEAGVCDVQQKENMLFLC